MARLLSSRGAATERFRDQFGLISGGLSLRRPLRSADCRLRQPPSPTARLMGREWRRWGSSRRAETLARAIRFPNSEGGARPAPSRWFRVFIRFRSESVDRHSPSVQLRSRSRRRGCSPPRNGSWPYLLGRRSTEFRNHSTLRVDQAKPDNSSAAKTAVVRAIAQPVSVAPCGARAARRGTAQGTRAGSGIPLSLRRARLVTTDSIAASDGSLEHGTHEPRSRRFGTRGWNPSILPVERRHKVAPTRNALRGIPASRTAPHPWTWVLRLES